MGFFGSSNGSLMAEIEKATSEQNTTEKWGIIMDICDKVGTSSSNAKECLKLIVKRLNHADPHVNMQAITLLDACVNNCGKNFHLEIASREFETEFKKLLTKTQPQVVSKLKQCLKKWAENDFKTDPQLNLIPSLYQHLKSKGYDFSEPQTGKKRIEPLSKDPNVVSSQQEEDDIAKAIELSLKEKHNSPKSSATATSSLYPSVSSAMASATPAPEPRKVRALYDFEAAEDNELTFKAGEIIMVIEDSDPNWWKGTNHRGEGLFPSNFVSADLSAEPDRLDSHKSSSNSGSNKKSVQFEDIQIEDQKEQVPEINEDSIDRLLFLLHEADPEDPSQDSKEMLRLEHTVNQMGPLIDMELERVDRKHAQLTQLSSDLVDAINLYHSLMRDSDRVMSAGPGYMGPYPGMQQPPFGYPGAPPQHPQHNMYGNMFHPQMNSMPPNSMGMPGMGMPAPHNNLAGPPSMGHFPPTSMSAFVPASSAPTPPYMPPTSSAPGAFPVLAQSQMPPSAGPNQAMPNANGHNLPNDPNSQLQQGPPPSTQPQMNNMLNSNQMPQQSLPGNNNFPTQLPNQMNGMANGGQPNFPQMNHQQPPTSQQQQQQSQQMTHMMGNLSINPGMNPGTGMHPHLPLQQLPQQHHPVTYIQQNDANQNIPIYQQR